MGKTLRGVLTGMLGASMAFSSLGAVSAAPTPKDIKGHWAEERLQEWVDKGYLQGYQNGTVQPNRPITRAEFVAMINRVFGYTETSSVKFTDLPAGNWAFADISKAVKAGYIEGYANNTIRPNAIISRQEAAVIIARVLGLTPESGTSLTFKDAKQIATWSKDSVAAVAAKDIINGYPNGSFGPHRPLTRAEAVTMIRQALTNRPAQGTMYDKAGTYGSATVRQTLTGNVTVSVPGVTLQNMDITGDLILAEGIGQGDVTLDNVKVNGKTYIYGGGSDTVRFKDTTLGSVIVDKKTGTVRLLAEGTSAIQNTTLESPAALVEQNLTGTGFTDVELSKELTAHSLVTLTGGFNSVDVLAPSIQLHLTAGSIQTLTIGPDAANATIRLDSGTNVARVVLNAVAKVVGTGTIQTAVIHDAAKGTTFETQPKTREGSGSTPTPGSGSGTSPTPGSGSGGGTGGGGTTPDPDPETPATPTLSTYGVAEISTVSADVYLNFNYDGKVYYVTLPEKAKAPGPAQVIAGTDANGEKLTEGTGNVAAVRNTKTTISIKDLQKDTPYTVYMVGASPSYGNSALVSLNFRTKAQEPENPGEPGVPVITDPGYTEGSVTTTTASVYFDASEAGTVYYAVLDAVYSAPDANEIIGKKISGDRNPIYGNASFETGKQTLELRGLEPGTKYVAYFVIRDNENKVSEVVEIRFTTLEEDKTAPVISNARAERLTTVTGDVYFTSDENGEAFYVVLPDRDDVLAPRGEEIIKGQYADGQAFESDMSGSDTISKSEEHTLSFNQLQSDQAYIAYVVVRDKAGNVSDVAKIAIPLLDGE